MKFLKALVGVFMVMPLLLAAAWPRFCRDGGAKTTYISDRGEQVNVIYENKRGRSSVKLYYGEKIVPMKEALSGTCTRRYVAVNPNASGARYEWCIQEEQGISHGVLSLVREHPQKTRIILRNCEERKRIIAPTDQPVPQELSDEAWEKV